MTCYYCESESTILCDGRIRTNTKLGSKSCDRELCQNHATEDPTQKAFFCYRSRRKNPVTIIDYHLCPRCLNAKNLGITVIQ
jgi:hypothetical protein